ncbi:hypothetical protein NDA18_005826 [Ustilago nuda]|nr:hypothetical protein NDA18_005826 [Ustilago nuda]
MLRGLARQSTPSLRQAVELSVCSPSSSIARASPLALQRSFAASSRWRNDKDKSASMQELESQASGQPTSDPSPAGSSNVSDAQQRDLSSQPAEAEATASSGRSTPSTNLDDILGSVSAVSSTLPGSEASAEADSASSTFQESRSPLIRGSRYSSTQFNTSSSFAQPHRLFVNSSRNNTILTLTSPTGDPLASASGGSVGFKKSARSGYEAGYRAAFSMFGKINEFKNAWRIVHLEVLWNGFGQGREAVFRALLAGEGQTTKNLVSKMTDKTPLKIGGVRPKKRRML